MQTDRELVDRFGAVKQSEYLPTEVWLTMANGVVQIHKIRD